MIQPNDTLCTKDIKNIDITTAPTINENQKEDKQHHLKHTTKLHRLTPSELYNINYRQFSKNYIMADCPYCGHQHPITRFMYRKIEAQVKRDIYKLIQSAMTPEQIKLRNFKGGVNRALKAGQTLKPSTIQKCTGRKIYREVASVLQI